MADKIPQGMSDKSTLRDASKMVSNNRSVLYAAIALVVLVVAGFVIYSASDSPTLDQTPATTTTQ
jgi:cell division protein FtsL